LPNRRPERREVGSAWCNEPVQQLDPGCAVAPLIVAPLWEARRPDSVTAAHLARSSSEEGRAMEVCYSRCCGLDVHKRTIVACLLTPGEGGRPRKEIRSFGTMTEDVLALADWLVAAGCTHVALESTGVY